jgi:hypothetical protein
MNGKFETKRSLAGAVITMILGLLPVVAFAVETDRLTVEDPANGTVKFRVTSSGNVTGGVFTGDGAGLSNVAHWKGTWSGATPYAKDDTVYYNGSSYIALQASTNLAPNANPTYWTVMASQGPAGAAGAAGAAGPQGPQGPAGIGSADTQTDILNKLATQTNGAVLSMQQAVGEAAANQKFVIKDSAGNVKAFMTSDGRMVLGNDALNAAAAVKLYFVSPTSGGAVLFLDAYGGASGTVIGMRNANGTKTSPSATTTNNIIGGISARGYDGTAFPVGSNASIFMNAASNWTPTSTGTYIDFGTTPIGSITKATQVRIADSGNVGIGTTSPSQKLEVNGGVRLFTVTPQPDCSNATPTTRGTFWVIKGATDDVVQVCVMVGGSLQWKTVQVQ